MSISFSGLATGLDTASWVEALVSVKQQKVTSLQSDLSALKNKKATLIGTKSTVSSLRTALEKLTDTKFGGAFDIFGKNTATSSNKDVFTATCTGDAARQSYDITVQQLATCTKAVSAQPASDIASDDTALSQLGIKAGTLSAYVNGKKTTINIEETDNLGTLKTRLAEAGIKSELSSDGILTLSAQNEGDKISIGATTDTSNLVSLTGLTQQEDGTYASVNALFKASTASVLASENAGFKEAITKGTFTIGNASFTITDSTTLSSLIYQINNSDEAQANAYWDDTTGRLNITSKKEGASYINIEAGTSNFTDIMGLTETERDADGNVISSKLCTDAQVLGQNSKFTINGTEMVSTSNTVTADVSRLQGVTLTLKKVSSEEDGVSKLDITQDTSGLVDAVKSIVNCYNDTIAKIDEITANGADFQRESSLTSLKRTLINFANSSNSNGGAYKLLSQVGISTASADGNNLSQDTYKLSLDENKLLAALEEDPESVKALLSGENSIIGMMETTVEQALAGASGFFDIKTTSLDSDITDLGNKITKQSKKISTYRTQLEKKFNKMEQIIAQMQQNYTSFLS